jgi:RNA polymerase sigma-70 factor, ECF subfamily
MLADIYDFKVVEIAEVLNVTAGVVKHLLNDARTTMENIFEHRCALINKRGVCHQCSEQNGLSNTNAETQRKIAKLELVKASRSEYQKTLFKMRTEL